MEQACLHTDQPWKDFIDLRLPDAHGQDPRPQGKRSRAGHKPEPASLTGKKLQTPSLFCLEISNLRMAVEQDTHEPFPQILQSLNCASCTPPL